jgi:hypothetical protein
MFTAEARDQVRDRIIEMAQSDPRVTAGALIGSTAAGLGDWWSDIDLTFGIVEGTHLRAVLDERTARASLVWTPCRWAARHVWGGSCWA